MYFSEPRAHAVSLFVTSNILPINMLYVETVSSLMCDVSRLSVPSNISDLFIQVNKIHTHKTRSSSSGNFYIKSSNLGLNQGSFARFGAKIWNSFQNKFRQLPKSAFKRHVHDLLFLVMEAEAPVSLFSDAVNAGQCLNFGNHYQGKFSTCQFKAVIQVKKNCFFRNLRRTWTSLFTQCTSTTVVADFFPLK